MISLKSQITKSFVDFVFSIVFGEYYNEERALACFPNVKINENLTPSEKILADIKIFKMYTDYVQKQTIEYLESEPDTTLCMADIYSLYSHSFLQELNNAF